MKHEILSRLRNSEHPVILNGAGIVGETVLGILEKNGIAVAGVCDGSVKVSGTDFHGHAVIYTPELQAHFDEAIVVITSAAIKDVVDSIEAQGLTDWVAGGPLLEDIDVDQDGMEIDQHKFSIETCIICHRGYIEPDRAFIRSIDLIITERCSLKCKDCANLMQYYERPKNVDLDLLFQSIDSLCEAVDEIMEMRVIGGDAFMNKRWPDVIGKLIGEPKVKRVVVYTNGTIVPKPDQAILLAHPKVLTVVTDYGALSRNLEPLKACFAEHGIAHRVLTFDNWLDCASLEKHDRTYEENAQVYKECCAKNMLSLTDGKLFRCPFAANADRLTAIPDFPGDYVDVMAREGDDGVVAVRREVMDYILKKDYLEVCDYCNGRPLSGKEVKPAVQVVAPLTYRKYSRTLTTA